MIELFSISFMIIYIDYFVIVSISRQIILTTFNINKFNFRLIKASQYLLNFNFVIRYKINKSNVILNALFKLSKTKFDSFFERIFNVFYDYVVEILDPNLIKITKIKVIYHITLIKMSNDFKIRFR